MPPPPVSEPAIQTAARLLAQGRPEEAAHHLGTLTAEAPTYAAAHVLHATALEAAGYSDDALDAWARVAVLVPRSPLVRRERARLLTARREGDSAEGPPSDVAAIAAPLAAGLASQERSEDEEPFARPSGAGSHGGGVSENRTGDAKEASRDVPQSFDAEALLSGEAHEETAERSDWGAPRGDRPPGDVTPYFTEEEPDEPDPPDEPSLSPDDDWVFVSKGASSGPPASADDPNEFDVEAGRLGEGFSVADELDSLISQLEDAPRIRPDPTFSGPPVSFATEDADEVASETLAKIYEAQRQFSDAAAVYEKLAARQPDRADEFLERAASARQKA